MSNPLWVGVFTALGICLTSPPTKTSQSGAVRGCKTKLWLFCAHRRGFDRSLVGLHHVIWAKRLSEMCALFFVVQVFLLGVPQLEASDTRRGLCSRRSLRTGHTSEPNVSTNATAFYIFVQDAAVCW